MALDAFGRWWRWLQGRLEYGLSPVVLVGTSGVLLVFDRLSRGAGDSVVPGGPIDEIAHLATALLGLGLLSPPARRRVLGPALIASVAIDADHVPGALGGEWLTRGTARPYPHSLLAIALVLALAWAWRRRRDVLNGIALGLALHFFRDLGEGGSGVSLLWPFTDHVFQLSHARYLELCAVLAGLCAVRYQLAVRAARTCAPDTLWRDATRRRDRRRRAC